MRGVDLMKLGLREVEENQANLEKTISELKAENERLKRGAQDAGTITSNQCAARLGIHPITLSNWRGQGRGPRFRKLGHKVVYPLAEIEDWEQKQMRRSTVG